MNYNIPMPAKHTTPKMMRRAAELRSNQTEAEAKLWAYLRAHRVNGIHFRRQYAIGKYIVDFCAIRKKLIIELDGSQHLEQEDYDKERTDFLESKGFRVLRFWNNEVLKNINGVMAVILDELKSKYRIVLSDFYLVTEIKRRNGEILGPGQEILVEIKKADPWDDELKLSYVFG